MDHQKKAHRFDHGNHVFWGIFPEKDLKFSFFSVVLRC